MKILFLILILSNTFLLSQQVEIKGNAVINNTGKITVKKRNVNIENNSIVNNTGTFTVEERILNSLGTINNDNGQLILNYQGVTFLSQTELKGYVEFNHDQNQTIPAVTFDSLALFGKNKKFTPNNLTLKTDFEVTSLFKTAASVDITGDDPDNINNGNNPKLFSHKNTEHDGGIDKNVVGTVGAVDVILSTDSSFAQINGTGLFKNLEIDKENGATITRGGWSVQNRLTLRNGILYNTDETGQNFTLEDGSQIVIVDGNFELKDEAGITRYPQSRINVAPNFEGKVNIVYTGDGEMEIGPEMPINKDILNILTVENSEGTTFTRDAYVNDRLTIASNIYMDSDENNDGINDKENTLYYTGINSGIDFLNPEAEIHGNFARTRLSLSEGESQTFNNAYTWVEFGVGGNDLSNNGGDIDTFQVRIEPNTEFDVDEYDEDSEFKVRRKIKLTAKDASGNEIDSVNDVRFGYGWKHIADNNGDPRHETSNNPDVIFNELVLQRWDAENEEWIDQSDATSPLRDNDNNFAYASARINGPLGEFAVGMTIAKYLAILAKAMLEGAYSGGDTMRTTLNDSLILSNTPPAEYPYNLDPNRANIVVADIPDSVVDWIVLEFRDGPNIASNNRYYKTCFLTKDGSIVDTNGSPQIQVWSEDTGINVKGGDGYYLAIRHRNHLAVVTLDPIKTSTREATDTIDFTDPSLIYGNDLKVIGIDSDGFQIHGLYAGNTDLQTTFEDTGEQFIGVEDVDFITPHIGSWDLNPKNRYMRSDVNMDGIVTTKDYNISWNNRGKISAVD